MTSVVVPVHNAQAFLGDLLQSLVRQDFRGDWEIVAVDNRSTDQSASIAAGFSSTLPIRVVTASDRANPAYARNAGVRAARGDKLLFIDADDVVNEGYVREMACALDDSPYVTSRVDSRTLNPEWVRTAHGNPWQANGVDVFFDFLPAAGANIGIRRSLFDTLGGFSERFSWAEDLALSWRAQLTAGVPPRFVEPAVYLYRYRTTYWRLFIQGIGWGEDSVLLYLTFGAQGMPGRSATTGAREWAQVLGGMLFFPNAQRRAQLLARLGLCVGRLKGAMQYRVLYL